MTATQPPVAQDEAIPRSTARTLISGPTSFIDGRWVDGDSDQQVDILDPSTGHTLRTVSMASAGQTEAAVLAARRAFDSGPWSRTTPRERSDLLNELADLVTRNNDDLLDIVVAELGAPIALSQGMHVSMPVANLRWAAEIALGGPSGGYEQSLLPHAGPPLSSSLLQRVPVGVVAGIAGYNAPINSMVWKLGPGLAAGCTLVLKSSPRAPLSTVAFVKLVEQLGLPPGVVNLVTGDGDAGTVLSTHPLVDMVMFTGSYGTGRRIMAAAATTTKRLVLELGGKSATIVLPGTDLDEITQASVLRWVRNAGQACGATTRTLVPRALYDDYAARAGEYVSGLRAGLPRDPASDLGPLIRDDHRAFVEGHVERALSRGAEVLGGGGRPDGLTGFFVNPTLLSGVGNDDPIAQEELFGPVGLVLPYDDAEQAIDIAHDSPYGLHAAVYGVPVDALAVARRLRAGTISVNGGGVMRPEGPWGGFKLSGFGREMGEDGFREFFQTKHIQWPIR